MKRNYMMDEAIPETTPVERTRLAAWILQQTDDPEQRKLLAYATGYVEDPEKKEYKNPKAFDGKRAKQRRELYYKAKKEKESA